MKHVISEDLMFGRHRNSSKTTELIYEFTKDPALRHQYYVLRSLLFKKELQVDLPAQADELDEISEIFIVRKGNHVVGGARMQVFEPNSKDISMIDYYGGNARELLSDYNMEHCKCCEFSRVIIADEFQNGDTITNMYRKLHEHTINNGFNFSFLIGMTVSFRMHRRVFSRLGIEFEFRPNISVPKANELTGQKFGLIIVDNAKHMQKNIEQEQTEEIVA